MKSAGRSSFFRFLAGTLLLAGLGLATPALAEDRYAAVVMDARTNEVLLEDQADEARYPASLTKMMTLYMLFEALERGDISMDTRWTASRNAARQPPSRLGLGCTRRRGCDSITVEQAINALVVQSANDVATLVAERLGGSEARFAANMTARARELGLSDTRFANASGLPDSRHRTTARDMALLSQALWRDFPQYYRYFSAKEFAYKGRVLPNTNKILKSYPDADGLKTGFTCGSGYNLIASAKRDGKRLIGVLLGARSSAERFKQMGNLLDLGFEKSQAGIFGSSVEQIKNVSLEPPPFQLSSNGCAGSAKQMGADSDSGNPDPIRIRPKKSTQLAKKHSTAKSSGKTHASNSNWAVMLNDRSRKTDADMDLNRARRTLGVSAKQGHPQVVRVKIKGKHFWRTEWLGLDHNEASSFCKKLRQKGFKCALLPGNA